MTTEEKNIKIAQFCGIKTTTRKEYSPHWRNHSMEHSPCRADNGAELPDYFSDLNAIYAAEESAGIHGDDLGLRVRWSACLREAVKWRCPVNKIGSHQVSDIAIYCASATERAEAFGMTFKLW